MGRTQNEHKKFCRALDLIEDKIEKAIKKDGQREMLVQYSAYESDEDHNPIDNLHEIPFGGKLVLVMERNEFFGGKASKPYRSKVLTAPTWLEIAVCANRMIKKTRDQHHRFLEGFRKVGEETINGEIVAVCRFSMGS